MVEGGLGVTLLPELTLEAGILKGTHLVARPFTTQVPSRTIALVARASTARSAELDLLAGFITELHARASSRTPARKTK
jgi:LysR family hydrogen peroxide-inducible transcriptional activator